MSSQHIHSIGVLLICALSTLATQAGSMTRASDENLIRFLDGSTIKLCTVRGAKVSASDKCITAADLVCRPVYPQEMRFHSDYGAAWWMIELPRSFTISQHRIGYRDPMNVLQDVRQVAMCRHERNSRLRASKHSAAKPGRVTMRRIGFTN